MCGILQFHNPGVSARPVEYSTYRHHQQYCGEASGDGARAQHCGVALQGACVRPARCAHLVEGD